MKLAATVATALIFLPWSASATEYACSMASHFFLDSHTDHVHNPTSEELNFAREAFVSSFLDVHPGASFDKVTLDAVIEDPSAIVQNGKRVRDVGSAAGDEHKGLRGSTPADEDLSWGYWYTSFHYEYTGWWGCPLCWDDDDYRGAVAAADSPVDGEKNDEADGLVLKLTAENQLRWEDAWCATLKTGPYPYFSSVSKCFIPYSAYLCTEVDDLPDGRTNTVDTAEK